jgi:hypothetical protein
MDTPLKLLQLRPWWSQENQFILKQLKRAMLISKDSCVVSISNVIIIVNLDIDAIAPLTFYWSWMCSWLLHFLSAYSPRQLLSFVQSFLWLLHQTELFSLVGGITWFTKMEILEVPDFWCVLLLLYSESSNSNLGPF